MDLRKHVFGILFISLLFAGCSDDDSDDPTPDVNGGVVSLAVSSNDINEDVGGVGITFSVNNTFDTNLTITFSITGSATSGEDYEEFSQSAVIVAGETSITGTLAITDDVNVEEDEEIIIAITGVTGAQDVTVNGEAITIVIRDNDSFAYENGILVLHEGNFFGGNASVSFVSDDLSSVNNAIFSNANLDIGRLGDVAQSMAFDGDLAYIVVNNSQKIEVVNRFTFSSEGTIDTGLLNPRYITFASGKGYVTNWGDGTNPDDDYIAVVNLENLMVESTISVPEGPEWILNNNGTLYVAHQGGFSQNNIVSVIDSSNDTVGTPITVADRPNSMQMVNDELWVLSGGNPAFTGNETAGQLDKINMSSNLVVDTFTFTQTEHPNYLSVDGSSLYYLLDGNVFKMDASDTTLPSSSEIAGVSFYDMTVNDGRLYGVDAKDFASNGSLEVYNLSNNSLVESLEVSIIPGAVYFNDSFVFE